MFMSEPVPEDALQSKRKFVDLAELYDAPLLRVKSLSL